MHEKVYNLSRKYGPPKTDLRIAEIMDSWGSEEHAQLILDHKVPEDVKKEDFDYYTQVFVFMELEDLLFYLYPVATLYEKDPGLDQYENYLFALNNKLPKRGKILSEEDKEALKEGLHWLYNQHPTDEFSEWETCTTLQMYMGYL